MRIIMGLGTLVFFMVAMFLGPFSIGYLVVGSMTSVLVGTITGQGLNLSFWTFAALFGGFIASTYLALQCQRIGEGLEAGKYA